jgi:excisionase family DNA binding protein
VSSQTSPNWLSIPQVAEKIGVHPNTIRNLVQRGELPAVRIGARIIRIDEAQADALLTPYVGGEFGVWSK